MEALLEVVAARLPHRALVLCVQSSQFSAVLIIFFFHLRTHHGSIERVCIGSSRHRFMLAMYAIAIALIRGWTITEVKREALHALKQYMHRPLAHTSTYKSFIESVAKPLSVLLGVSAVGRGLLRHHPVLSYIAKSTGAS